MDSKKQEQIVIELLKLMNQTCSAMMQTVQVQDDALVADFLGRSFGRLFESRYWLTETLTALQTMNTIKKEEASSAKKKN